jgi:ABC-2 type transport system permease protein
MIMSMLFAALAMVIMIGAGLIAGKIHLGAGQLAIAAAILIVGSVPFCAVGLFIGAHSSGGAAPAFVNLIYLPMIWLSGLFIPLPGVMQDLRVIWPAYHLDRIAMYAIGLKDPQSTPVMMSIIVLVAMTVVFGGAAIRRLARSG